MTTTTLTMSQATGSQSTAANTPRPHKLVKDWMTPNPITILPTTYIRDAYQLMHERQIRRLPVVELGKLVGIVTLGDLRSMGADGENSEVVKVHVDAVLHANPITVNDDAPLVDAARIMIQHKFSGLPVLSASHQTLAGIVTESDILRAFIADETR